MLLCQTVFEGEEFKSNEKGIKRIGEVAGIKNETFTYWDNFVEYLTITMNLIRGDGEGMWDLHLDSMQKAVKLFEAMDVTNYKRWGEIYLEDMRRLSVTAPEVHRAFMMGQFVVKRAIGEFNAVGLDLALEQSIQRSK